MGGHKFFNQSKFNIRLDRSQSQRIDAVFETDGNAGRRRILSIAPQGFAAKRLLGGSTTEKAPEAITISCEMRQTIVSYDRMQKCILVNRMGLGLLQTVLPNSAEPPEDLPAGSKRWGNCPSDARTRKALNGAIADAKSWMPDLPLFVTLQGMARGGAYHAQKLLPEAYPPVRRLMIWMTQLPMIGCRF
jgi:hypothetical protein